MIQDEKYFQFFRKAGNGTMLYVSVDGGITGDPEQAARYFGRVVGADFIPAEGQLQGYGNRATDLPLASVMVPCEVDYKAYQFECVTPKGEHVVYLVSATNDSEAVRALVSEKCVRIIATGQPLPVDNADASTQVLCGMSTCLAKKSDFAPQANRFDNPDLSHVINPPEKAA